MLRKKKFLIGGFIVIVAIGYLGFTAFQSSATYYYTVSELMDKGSLIYEENVRVNGDVAAGSVEKEGLVLVFDVVEGGSSLPVFYQGVVPDTFKDGSEVVIEGSLDASGTFQAHTIMTKCPSKYEPQVPE